MGIRQFAINHNLSQTVEMANSFIRRSFTLVITGDEFLDLNVVSLVEMLSSDELHIDSEEIIFNAAIRWLNHDIVNRQVHAVR